MTAGTHGWLDVHSSHGAHHPVVDEALQFIADEDIFWGMA
jgi:hypothetical protein